MDRPFGRGQQRREHLDRRGLAGAIGPEECENLTRLDAERYVIDGRQLAECFGQ